MPIDSVIYFPVLCKKNPCGLVRKCSAHHRNDSIIFLEKFWKHGNSISFLCLSCCGMSKMGSGLQRRHQFPFDRNAETQLQFWAILRLSRMDGTAMAYVCSSCPQTQQFPVASIFISLPQWCTDHWLFCSLTLTLGKSLTLSEPASPLVRWEE